MVYQTTWLREFRLIFGASTAATAAVLGIFMGGIGVGSAILSRRSESLLLDDPSLGIGEAAASACGPLVFIS